MSSETYEPGAACTEGHLAFAIHTINAFTCSLVLLLVISWGAHLIFVGVPDTTSLDMDDLNQLFWLPYVAFGLSFVLLPVVIEQRRGCSIHELGLLPGHKWFSHIAWGFLIGAVWFLYVALLSGMGGNLGSGDGSTLALGILLGNYLAVAVGEEVLFRSFLQRRLGEILQPRWAIIITGLIFGTVLHLSSPIEANLLFRVPGGIMLGYLFFWRQSIWSPVAAHWLYNSLPALLAFLLA